MLRVSRCLVIEDEPSLKRALRAGLSHAGFEVIGANDGQEGMAALHKYTPDIVLLDLILPKMDSADFLKQMRKDRRFRATPVFVLSNLGLEG